MAVENSGACPKYLFIGSPVVQPPARIEVREVAFMKAGVLQDNPGRLTLLL